MNPAFGKTGTQDLSGLIVDHGLHLDRMPLLLAAVVVRLFFLDVQLEFRWRLQ